MLAIPLLALAVSPAWVLAALTVAAAGLVVFKSLRYGVVSAGAGVDEGEVSGSRQDARHESLQVQDGEGGTTGASESEVGQASV